MDPSVAETRRCRPLMAFDATINFSYGSKRHLTDRLSKSRPVALQRVGFADGPSGCDCDCVVSLRGWMTLRFPANAHGRLNVTFTTLSPDVPSPSNLACKTVKRNHNPPGIVVNLERELIALQFRILDWNLLRFVLVCKRSSDSVGLLPEMQVDGRGRTSIAAARRHASDPPARDIGGEHRKDCAEGQGCESRSSDHARHSKAWATSMQGWRAPESNAISKLRLVPRFGNLRRF